MAAIRQGRISNEAQVVSSISANNIEWRTQSYDSYSWSCSDCGKIWEKRWQAETCPKRNHVASFAQRYGGHVENGKHVGGKTFIRRSIQPRAHAPKVVRPERQAVSKTLCRCGSGHERYDLTDARGIFCTYVCSNCEQQARSHYRPDIFTDANYWHDEPI